MPYKNLINENSKMLGWYGVFPELNHNEIVGWGGDEKPGNFSVVLLRDSEDHPRVQRRMELTREIFFDGKVRNVIDVNAIGSSNLERLLSLIYIGDYTSVYLAMLRKIDPTPVTYIEEFKKRLDS